MSTVLDQKLNCLTVLTSLTAIVDVVSDDAGVRCQPGILLLLITVSLRRKLFIILYAQHIAVTVLDFRTVYTMSVAQNIIYLFGTLRTTT